MTERGASSPAGQSDPILEANERRADEDELEKSCDEELTEDEDKIPQTPPTSRVLSLQRVYGINPHLPVFSLRDQDQDQDLVMVYAAANVAVIYNHTSNSQRLLQGDGQLLSCLCVSGERRWVATADWGSPSSLMIWDSYSGFPVKTFSIVHSDGGVTSMGGVTAMGFSDHSDLLVTVAGGNVQRVCVWDWTKETQQPLWFTDINPGFGIQHSVSFNPNDSSQIVSSSKSHGLLYTWVNDNLQVFGLNPKKFRRRCDSESTGTTGLTGFPGSNGFTGFTGAGCVFHWCKPQLVAPSGGHLLICDVMDGSIPNRSTSHDVTKVIDLQHQITVLTVTDRLFVVGNTRGHVLFYDDAFRLMTSYKQLRLQEILSLSFSKESTQEWMDGKPVIRRNFLASTGGSTVVHVNARRRFPRTLLQGERGPVHAVACHPHRPQVVTGNGTGTIKVWNYQENVLVSCREFPNKKQIQCVSFDPQGLYLALGFGGGAVEMVNPDSLQSEQECFQFSHCVHIVTFSWNSVYLSTADEGMGVSVFVRGSHWSLLGRYCSHYQPITDLLFGVLLDRPEPRLLSLGLDRRLVEYDLETNEENQLVIRCVRVEQRAVPLCMAWYPPTLATEQLLLTASDQYKFKLLDVTTKTCRKTFLGPMLGSPVEQMLLLPKTHPTNGLFLLFCTRHEVGLQMLPVDGSPSHSTAVMCHSTGVSAFAPSHDGRFLFTAGHGDGALMGWQLNPQVMEAPAALGGLQPFLSLLDGGKDGHFYQEMEDYFLLSQIEHEGLESLGERVPSDRVPLSKVPDLMRALCHFPTEQEIEDMQNEVRFSHNAQSGEHGSDLDLGEFIKLYLNHRPAFGPSHTHITEAFQLLGSCDSAGTPVIDRQQLMELLQTGGERMTEEELCECLTSIVGLNDTNEEEEGNQDSRVSQHPITPMIPEEVSMETFLSDILKLPSAPTISQDDTQLPSQP